MNPRIAHFAQMLALVAAFMTATGVKAAEPAEPVAPVGAVRAVTAIGIAVGDVNRSIAFYRDVLQFEHVGTEELADGRRARLRLGDETLELTQFAAPGREFPADSRSNDRWFQHIAIIVRDMGQAYARLREAQVVHASPAPQRLPDWNKNAGGIEAFYFRDPDGHYLEILAFPPDKGDARWHRKTAGDQLFLGIDHTAIVVADTAASLAFYRDELGLRVAGESENYGPEQERLNNVAGARLRITTLRSAAGPGIELLEYLAPRDGRPRPADVRPSDLVYWETTVSRGPGTGKNTGKSRLFADPDGHVLRIVE